MKKFFSLIAFMIGLSCPILSIVAQAQMKEFQLIKHEAGLNQDSSTALHMYKHKDAATRFTEVDLCNKPGLPSTISPNDQIHLNLCPGAEYDAQLQRMEKITDGNVHTSRNAYRAGLEQLFTTMGGCINRFKNSIFGMPVNAFSCKSEDPSTAYTPIHEMDHSIDCEQYKEQNFEVCQDLYTHADNWKRLGTDGNGYVSEMIGAEYFQTNPDNPTGAGYFPHHSVSLTNMATRHSVDSINVRANQKTKHVIAEHEITAPKDCIPCPGYDFTISPENSWSTHSSSIEISSCKMYRISVEKGRTYTFKTGCGNGATANFDTIMEILDKDCTQVAYNDDTCGTTLSMVSWMATYTGYAYLKVRGWYGASGSYTMAYQRSDILTWQGDVSTNWNTAGNWDGNVVPNYTFDVIIPTGAIRQPYVQSTNAACGNLTLQPGTILTIGAYSLSVEEDADMYGTLIMNNTASKLYVNDDIRWQSGSSASVTGNATIYVYGDWDFLLGANVYITTGFVDFKGSSISYIRSKDSDSHFYNVRNNKNGTSLTHNSSSTYPCRLTGNLYIYENCSLTSNSNEDFIIGNFVNNMSGSIALNKGTFVFDGSSGSSSFVAGDYFNNIKISSSGTTTFNNDIEIRGNLLIESGALSLGSTTLKIKGLWQNDVGTNGFIEGTSTVIFNGLGYQYIHSSETFNVLEANMGNALRINNAAFTVTCNQYKWTSGGIDVIAGTFTALDLAQNGLYGGFWVNPGGTINLTNSGTGTYIDLCGSVNILGGTMNLNGTYADWPYANGANFTMTDGVLDFKTSGLTIYNGYSWTNNVSGGTIRTYKGYQGHRGDFTPTGGTLELYGSGDFFIRQSNGSTIHHVNINKSVKEGGDDDINGPVYDERSGELLSEGGKDNTIILNSNFTITGNLNIDAGTFSLGSYSCNVTGNTNIYGTLEMTNAANNLTSGEVCWYSGSDDNVTAGNFYADAWKFNEGTNAKLGTGNTAYIFNLYYPNDEDAEFGNLVAVPSSKVLAGENGIKTVYPVKVAGNFTMQNSTWAFSTGGVDLIVQGNADIQNGSSLYFSAGNDFIVNGNFNLAGTLNLSVGSIATIEGELTFPSTGWLSLNQATFTNNYVSSYYSYLYGKLTMNGVSVLEFPGRSIYIGNSFTDEVSGGTLRFGRTLTAPEAGSFQLDYGTVEFMSGYPYHFVSVYNGNYLNDVVINKTTTHFQVYEDLIIKNNLEINSGVLFTGNKTISIGGNWINNVGPDAFSEGMGRVIFNGTGDQTCNSEIFNILEVNKASGVLNFPGTTVCAIYDWTAGGITVNGGTFTANDLADNSLYGSYTVNDGTINLHQDIGQFIDLAGNIAIGGGGVLNVHGGMVTSYWPYFSNASLTMSPGSVLDFKDVGIRVDHNAYSFTTNITGGTIRTSQGFEGTRADFTPNAGILEFYGSGDYFIFQSNGSTVHHVNINKSAKEGGDDTINGPIYDERSGKLISDGGKANTMTLLSDFTITGNLNIDAGTFSLGSYSCDVTGSTNIYGTLEMKNAANNLTSGEVCWYSGSDDNVTAGNFYVEDWRFNEGTNAKLGTGNTAYIDNLYYPTDDDAEFGNLVAVSSSKVLAGENGIKAVYPVKVAGNFTMQNSTWYFSTSGVDLIVQGNADMQNGSSLYFSAGNDFIVNGTLDLAGTLNLGVGSVATIEGQLTFPSTGWLSLNQATFINNYSVAAYTYLSGKLTMNNNSFLEFPGRSIIIDNVFVNEVSGGTIRFGNSLAALHAGTFQLDFGTVEFISDNSGYFLQIGNGNYLNDVHISKTTGTLSVIQNLIIKNDLEIHSGTLRANDKTISIGGNWSNNAGPDAFNEGTGRVIFDGTGDQTCNSEIFNILEVNKASGVLNFPGTTVCAIYDWTAGGITVNGGTFTANDLADNGLWGTFAIYDGTMNLYQDNAQYVDLNGSVIIGDAGVLNIFGGGYSSYWPYIANASLTMSPGAVLDFKDVGIAVINDPAYSFTANITGGTIRTSRGFESYRADFTPTAGTFEFYGADNIIISQTNGSTLYNVLINKSTKENGEGTSGNPRYDLRSGTLISDGGKANKVDLATDFSITNNLTIQQGGLGIEYDQVSVLGNVDVNDGGNLLISGNGSLLMGASGNITINSGGLLELYGDAVNQPKISRISAGNYGLNIESEATIAARYSIFEYMNVNGINVKPGAIVDPTKAFTGCTFRLGQNAGRLLTLNNDQTLVIHGAIFPGSPGTYNVSKNVNTGLVSFVDYSGVFSGASYEQDPFNRIHWTGEISPTVNLQGVIISSGQEICFEALQTITTGGSAPFIVENMGTTHVVAGQNILMLPGTHAMEGSYFRAYISNTGFCSGLPLSMIAAKTEEEVQPAQVAQEILNNEKFFRIYPNPTRGTFILELTQPIEAASIRIEILTMLGERLLSTEQQTQSRYQFDLSNQNPGIYFIRVLNSGNTSIEKVIRQ